MKVFKNIIVVLLVLTFSCSSDSDGDTSTNGTDFDYDVNITTDAFEVDKAIKLAITSNQDFNSASISFNNWQGEKCRSAFDGEVIGNSIDIFTSFDVVGIHQVSLRVRKSETESYVQKDFQIEITKGNAVKIDEVKVISFHNINETWDDEFPDTDINRLADVNFAFEKQYITTSFDELEYSTKVWFISDVIMNQGNLTWNLNDDNLYIDPYLKFYFALGDDDGGGIGQDLMLGPPFSLPYESLNDISLEPETVSLISPNINLEVEFKIIW